MALVVFLKVLILRTSVILANALKHVSLNCRRIDWLWQLRLIFDIHRGILVN